MNRTPAAAPQGFQHQFADFDDVRLHYVIGGSGPLLLLLHGWPQTWFEWRKLMPRFAELGHTVVALDNRGFGDSSRPVTGYDRKTMANDVTRLIKRLGYSSLAVIGHDWGGAIAYSFAAGNPESVSHLAVIEGIPFGPWVFEVPSWKSAPVAQQNWFAGFHQIPDLPELLTKGHEREYLTYFYRHFSSAPETISEGDIDEFLRTYCEPGAMRAGFELYRAIPEDIQHNQKLAATKLRMPVLALGGELCYAGVIKEVMASLATNVSGGVIAGANHWIPEEFSEALLSQVDPFLRNLKV